MRQRPSRTLRRRAALATIRELRSTLKYIADELARADQPPADRLRLIELQLRYAGRVARLGATVAQD